MADARICEVTKFIPLLLEEKTLDCTDVARSGDDREK
jgi:hypothetical protein